MKRVNYLEPEKPLATKGQAQKRSYSVLRREVCIGPTCNPEKPVSDLSASKEPTSACQRNPLRTHLQSRGGNCVTPADTHRSPRASSTPASREI
ncbi:hypothetical protein AVEN_18071-1 [Araneus ventricosus]|uniref:Uncharacterized protein n=1 Tax=Araneus ventricosus TaxID=182803 RepID=A0A4Y2UC13_ARAVE|nr:hypothetical protein AVEN_18071-1 [Araneus ventricosus]